MRETWSGGNWWTTTWCQLEKKDVLRLSHFISYLNEDFRKQVKIEALTIEKQDQPEILVIVRTPKFCLNQTNV